MPQLGYRVDRTQVGLIPKTLAPLVRKRIALKSLLAKMNRRDCRYATLKQKNNAQKSLQTVAFGYMGHKHFKYTQIEVHESITAYSREAMFLTKALLEDAGYEVIHLYVDGIYFKRPEPTSEAEIERLLAGIETATGLPIGNEGVYKWIIFLQSREDPGASVPNRYFGVFANGEIKVRGIEARTRDTPPFIKEAQMAVIEHMAAIPFGERLEGCLPAALEILRGYVDQLRSGRAELDSLVITQVLTREVADYKANTRVARAGRQLEAAGKGVEQRDAHSVSANAGCAGSSRLGCWWGDQAGDGRQSALSRPADTGRAHRFSVVWHRGAGPTRLAAAQRDAAAAAVQTALCKLSRLGT